MAVTVLSPLSSLLSARSTSKMMIIQTARCPAKRSCARRSCITIFPTVQSTSAPSALHRRRRLHQHRSLVHQVRFLRQDMAHLLPSTSCLGHSSSVSSWKRFSKEENPFAPSSGRKVFLQALQTRLSELDRNRTKMIHCLPGSVFVAELLHRPMILDSRISMLPNLGWSASMIRPLSNHQHLLLPTPAVHHLSPQLPQRRRARSRSTSILSIIHSTKLLAFRQELNQDPSRLSIAGSGRRSILSHLKISLPMMISKWLQRTALM